MKIDDPEIYFGKKLRVIGTDKSITIGELYGYDYDFDDDDNEYLELDINDENGIGYSFTEDEIERIDIIG